MYQFCFNEYPEKENTDSQPCRDRAPAGPRVHAATHGKSSEHAGLLTGRGLRFVHGSLSFLRAASISLALSDVRMR